MCSGQMRKLETGLETQPTAESPPPPYELMRGAISVSQKVSRKKVHMGNKEQFEDAHAGIRTVQFFSVCSRYGSEVFAVYRSSWK